MLIDDKKVDSSVNVRLSKEDAEELKDIAKKVGCTVSQLTRYAVRKHILFAREVFEKNPDVWKEIQ